LDFNAFPLRIMETPDKPQEAILKIGFSDGIYNKSKGGRTFSGWTCDHLPYLVEFDNYGVSQHPGKPNPNDNSIWVWGYDEITWFAHQTKDYRAKWLQYAWDWVRKTDPNGYLEMPGNLARYAMVFCQQSQPCRSEWIGRRRNNSRHLDRGRGKVSG
jgi:hypothetical protein